MDSSISRPERLLPRFGGVSLESDQPIPELPLGSPRRETLAVSHGQLEALAGSPPEHLWPGDLGVGLYRAPDGWRYQTREGHAFHLDAEATRLRCAPHPEAHELLVRLVLPRVLHKRGFFVLHGSAVATPAGALAILGPSGAGKSTLAAFLSLHLSWPLLADDALVLELGEGPPILHPTSANARLWRDSAAWLGGGVVASRGLPRRPDKRECDLGGAAVLEGQPLHRVLVLDLAPGALGPGDAVVRILQHQVRFHPGDPASPARQMAQAARLASRVPVERLCLPRELASLPRVARELERQAS